MQRLFWLVMAAALLGLTGCTNGVSAPANQGTSTLAGSEDEGGDESMEVALKALRAIGTDVEGTTGRCAQCHNINLFQVRAWAQQARDIRWNCVENNGGEGVEPNPALVNCLRSNPADATSPFTAKKLGLYAAGAQQPVFSDLFKKAFPASEWEAQYQAFIAAVQMPITGEDAMTAEEFEAVMTWVNDGMAHLETLVGHPGNPPTECQENRSPAFLEHISKMNTKGWEAKNREAGIKMFACTDGLNCLGCFNQKNLAGADIFPESAATDMGKSWSVDMPQSKLRVLRPLGYSTSFWMRTSPDGRFVANGSSGGSDEDGNSYGARVSDLQSQLVDGAVPRDIFVNASYDPEFFPDNSGFMFQSTPVGAGFCRMSLVENPATTKINFDEAQCSGTGTIGLYQAVGASLDGSDYVAISGEFDSDYGSGQGDNEHPYWMERTYAHLTPIVHDGEVYKALQDTEIWTPYLGDWNISPSNELAIARIAGLDTTDAANDGDNGTKHLGYQIQFIEKKVEGDNYSFEMKPAATLCIKGGKGKISFNERFFVTYHYVTADDYADLGFANAEDPAFKALLEKGSANVYLYDLATGANRRVTRMGPGQFAIFPHFRADGWIYFMVNEENVGERYVVASDASLLMQAAAPLQ